MSKQMWIVIGIAIIFGVLRFVVPVEGKISHDDVFKDLAHLYVGGLIGAWLTILLGGIDKKIGWVALGLTVLEVVAFFIRRS